jgi:ABC-type branched-subunit amino acid transport system ATPase component
VTGAEGRSATDPLRVDDVTVRFGGLRALDDVSLRVPSGAIVGLVGPNGAGKTTLFNCATGVVRPTTGRVHLFGQDVTGWPVHHRARLGVGRTFQRLELFGSLSVLENLVVAVESSSTQGGLASDLLALPPSLDLRAVAEAKAHQILDELGLSAYASSYAGDLPGGVSRLVEVARALSTGPRLLLLDEPSSGLRANESEQLSRYLRQVRDDQGVSLLVVEHDMAFVLGMCEYVYVLDFGKLLAEGTPAQIRADPAVQAAYLGEEVEADDARPARRR